MKGKSLSNSRIRTCGLLAVASLALTACGQGVSVPAGSSSGAKSTKGAYPVTVSSCADTSTVTEAPRRVVSMSPSQTELLVRLGLTDRLVGQAQASIHPLPEDIQAKVKDVPVLSTTKPPAREELLSAEPDFVYSPTSYEFSTEQGFASVAQLKKAGAAAYVAAGGCFDRRKTGTVDDLFVDIKRLGTVFSTPKAADRVIADGRKRLNAVGKRVAGQQKPTVAQIYVDGRSISAIGAGVEYDILKRAGGRNLFSPNDTLFKTSPWAQISPEALAAKKPDFLVFSVQDKAHEKRVRDFLRMQFPTLPAVQKDQLVAIPASDVFPGTIGNVSAVEHLAEEFHPNT